jgi:hypothetical protein
MLSLGALWWQVSNLRSERRAPEVSVSGAGEEQPAIAKRKAGSRETAGPPKSATSPTPLRKPAGRRAASSSSVPAVEPPAWPEPDGRALTIAEEVERTIALLLADDSGERHAAAIERLLSLDLDRVAREVVYQFDALQPVGPLAPSRVDEAWEALRSALCAGRPYEGDPDALPLELGCRPSRP